MDDAWGLIAFSLLLVVARSINGDGGAVILEHSLWELGGALVVGVAVGLPAAYLTGQLNPGEPMQSEALGVVFLCAGLAVWLGASFLLAGMVAGIIVANLAEHHRRPFHEIEHIERPFMVLFFVLAGASMKPEALDLVGPLCIAYVVLRTLGRVVGGWLGGFLGGVPKLHRQWIGLALMPQAGIALGMALVGAQYLPDLAETLLAVTISSAIVFEVFGPILTLLALRKVEEAGSD